MIHDVPAVRRESSPPTSSVASAPVTAPEEPPSILMQVHRIMRGRYLWAALLGMLGLIGGATGGWFAAGEPDYRASGLLQIRPMLPKIMYETEQTQVMPMFDSFVQSQAELMQSHRTINLALQSDPWQEAGGGTGEDVQSRFRDQLNTRRVGGGELIRVTYSDPQRQTATAAVKALISAYQDLYRERYGQSESDRLQILEERRSSLRNELSSVRDRIKSIADEHGSDALEEMRQFKLSELQRVTSELRDIKLQLSNVPSSEQEGTGGVSGEADGGASSDVPIDELTPKQIAARDDRMQNLIDQRDAIEEGLEQAQVTLGPEHREVRRLNQRLQQAEKKIQEYASTYRERAGSMDGGVVGPSAKEQLERRKDQLQEIYDQLRAETQDLGRKQLEINRLKEEAKMVERQLSETKRRIEVLNVEAFSRVGGRIDVLSNGEDVVRADGERLRLAGVGGFGGAALGIGVVALLGWMDPRYRSPDDARQGVAGAPMIGVLPELPEDLSDPEHARLTARCLHSVRTMLQLGIDRDGRRVLTVSSPAAGDGKTSLTMALGFSFAASGQRVLLIDGDLATGNLSRRARALVRRKVGEIMVREGLIDEAELQEALTVSQASGRRVGETLVERKQISMEQLNFALNAQRESSLGLLEALEGEPLATCTTELGVRGLHLLPIGRATENDAERIAPERLREVLQDSRDRFDVVLVDSGPVLSGPDATLFSAQSDGTLLVISRGGRRAVLDAAAEQIRRVGATLTGVVFNRMDRREFNAYGSSGMVGDGSVVRSRPADTEQEDSDHRPNYGPIASTLSSHNGNGHQ